MTMDKAIDRLADMIEGGQLLASTDPAQFLRVCADRITELEKEVEQLRAALEKIIIKLEREGCTHRGCDQGIHTIQCPMEVVLLLEQALKGGE